MAASLTNPAARWKHLRLKTAVRKTVKWGGAGLTVLVVVVVWIGSGWRTFSWQDPDGHYRAFHQGRLHVFAPLFDAVPREMWEFWFPPHPPALEWWFDVGDWGGGSWCIVPLWFPALLSLLATAAAWRADAKYLRRARMGLCAGCGYDRTGLPATARCPECGKAMSA